MDEYLIAAQSVTQAQHMQRSLAAFGLSGRIVRGHRAISPYGCGYALQIPAAELEEAVGVLQREGFRPFRIYRRRGSAYREVVL